MGRSWKAETKHNSTRKTLKARSLDEPSASLCVKEREWEEGKEERRLEGIRGEGEERTKE